MKETDEFIKFSIKQLLEKGDSLNHEQRQMLIGFHAEMQTQESWKSDVFKEVLSEDIQSAEACKRREENLIRIQEMLAVSRNKRG